MSTLAVVDACQVTAIATEVFAAMIDHRGGLLTSWSRGPMTVTDPLHAWVDLGTVPASRLQVTTDAGTAGEVTRAFPVVRSPPPVRKPTYTCTRVSRMIPQIAGCVNKSKTG